MYSSGSADAAWGTRAAGADQVFEAGTIDARFSTGAPTVGFRDLTADAITVEYPLGSAGKKRIVFDRDAIRVTVEHPGAFTEQIPALGAGPQVRPSPSGTTDTGTSIAGKRLRLLRIDAKDRLEYEIRFR